MRFNIHHRTVYEYRGAATESFIEARLRPAETSHQRLIDHRLGIEPNCTAHQFVDYFGNDVVTFSIVHRHEQLTVDSYSTVETREVELPHAALEVSVSEARQIYRSEKLRLFEFLFPSPAITFNAEINRLANRFFRPKFEIAAAARNLNHWVNTTFAYAPGSTRINSPVTEVLAQKSGVCQDFAQVMIAILRSAEIPARYVVGYIETDQQRNAARRGRAPKKLIGAAESHAWVEVYLPGGFWIPLDPTNDCIASQRHVRVAVGRDYLDSTPTRGVFKGAQTKRLAVSVDMKREETPTPPETDRSSRPRSRA